VVLGGVLLVASLAIADGGKKNLNADALVGYQENPDISSGATGSFEVTIDDTAQALAYQLSYSGLEGTVQQAHIHFGKRAVNGGISVFLCTNLGNGPAGTPACPQSGTVSRTVGAADVVGPAGQGISAGEFNELVAAMRAGASYADGGKKNLNADALVGYQENPDISSGATGSFEVTIDDAAQALTYQLSYSGLEGTVQQAHIHFGKRAVNGGISVFLCTNLGNGPAGTPACPQSGTVSRTVGAAAVVGPVGQGISAGEFNELVAAMRAGASYANVHSTTWPGGEIRAQINDDNERSD